MKGIPHNFETERALIGGLLVEPALFPDVAARVAAEDFSRSNHVALFRILTDMHVRRETADIVGLLDEAARRGDAEDLGGTAYLVALPGACPSTDGLVHYADRIRDHAVRRRLLTAHSQGIEDVEAGERTTAELLDDAQARLSTVAAVTREDRPMEPIGQVVDGWLRDVERRSLNPGAITGVPSGFTDLDRMLCGSQPGEQTIMAARPAMGKTSLMLDMARHAAIAGTPVGIFSMEMSRQALVGRLVCQEGRVDSQRTRTGAVDAEDWRRLIEAGERVAALPIYIDDRRGLTVAQLRERARRMKREHGIGLACVDYLTLLAWTYPKANAETNTSHNSRALRDLWGDLGIPGIVLSQLNRSLESRGDKRPLPSDLRDSGAVEQDADTILFIYRDEVYNPDSADKGIAEVIVAKQRNGPIGKVKLAFLAQHTLFQNLADPGAYQDRQGHASQGYY